MLRERGVETVILAGADTHGIMRGKRLPVAELTRAAKRGVALCELIGAVPALPATLGDWETERYLEAL